MDSLVDFSPVDTSQSRSSFYILSTAIPSSIPCTLVAKIASGLLTNLCCVAGFINVNAIRLKKYGMQKVEEGQSLSKA